MTGAILLLGLGFALVIAEVLFPSFGVLSILATLAIIGAVILAFRDDQGSGFWFLGATLALLPLVILFAFKIFPKSPMGKHMVSTGLSFESRAATDTRDLELVGQVGDVVAKCRPAGVARLDQRRVDVVTRGEWIDAGERIRVVDVSGNRVVVVKAPHKESPETT